MRSSAHPFLEPHPRAVWAGLLILAAGCLPPVATKTEIVPAAIPPLEIPLTDSSIPTPAGPLHYVTSGDPGKVPVVFVHGSPGSWDSFRDFLLDPGLASRAWLVSVDRPGFGGTDAGRAEPSLAAQAARIAPLLATLPRPAILVGHSLGGPVIARLAMDYPERVAGLVFLSSPADPEFEKLRWYNHLAAWRWVGRLISPELRTSNREILPLRAELEAMLPLWASIRVPVQVLHGEQDGLVPVANADFLARVLPQAEVRRLPGAGHLLPWRRSQEVESAVLWMLARVEGMASR